MKIVEFEITRQCNFRCKHCYNLSGRKLSNEMSSEDIHIVLEKLSSFGVPEIHVGGGEPLLHKYIFDVIERCTYLFEKTVLETNGTLLNDMNVERLKRSEVNMVRISLDGFEAQHEYLRGASGSFQATLEGIRRSANKLNIQVNTVINRINCKSMEDFVDFIHGLGVSSHRLTLLLPAGRAKNYAELVMSKNEILEVTNNIQLLAKRYVNFEIDYSKLCRKEPTNVMLEKFYVDPAGRVRLYGFVDHTVGNILKDDIFSTISSSENIKQTAQNAADIGKFIEENVKKV